MPTMINGGVDLAAATAKTVIRSTTGSGGTYDCTVLNRNAASTLIDMGISTDDNVLQTPTQLVSQELLAPGKSLTFTRIVLKNNDYIVVQSSLVTVNAVAVGIDK